MTFGELVLSCNLDFEQATRIFNQLTPRRVVFLNAVQDIIKNRQFHKSRQDSFIEQFHASAAGVY
jgi:hypothetical protein